MNTKKSITGLVVAAALTAALSDTAIARDGAARVLRVEGDVLITSGTRSKNAVDGQNLRIGDRLIALEGGHAFLAFADGCDYVLEDGQILTVTELSPCARGLTSEAEAGILSGGAASAGAETGLAWIPPALGGLTALGAIGSHTAFSDDDTSTPVQGGIEEPLPPVSQ